MCGRYSLFDPDEMYDRFSIVKRRLNIDIEPHYNIAPSEMLPVVVKHSPNQVELMRWGLVPHWSKEPHVKYSTINARAENLASSSVYRNPFQTKRCLVPANGFFEWMKTSENKIPYFIHLKHESMFAFAGVYDVWTDAEGKQFKSFAIITCKPNALMEPIHNRMPVILRIADEEVWITPDETDIEKLLYLLQPYPSDEMEAYRVSTAVNKPVNDDPAVIQPVKT
jgi:putative SOS response-associated peptidase YedK